MLLLIVFQALPKIKIVHLTNVNMINMISNIQIQIYLLKLIRSENR